MYDLSKVLKAIDDIDSIEQDELSVTVNGNLKKLIDVLTDFDLINNGKVKRDYNLILKKVEQANAAIQEILDLTVLFKEKINLEKKQSHQQLLKAVNNKPYIFEWNDEADYLSQKSKWKVSDSIMEQTVSLIGKYIDWRFPVLYLEPHTGELTRHLISGDPFYFVDDRTLPYETLLKSMPPETVNRIYHYRKTDAYMLEPNSVGLCISWQNIPFKKLGEIRKDIEFMSRVTAPGGYVVFDYVDANKHSSAAAIEQGQFTFQWRDRILKFLNENSLEILHEIDFADYHPVLLFCKKTGNLPELNLSNKLGLVLPDHETLNEKRKAETELRRFYKNITSNLQKDIEALEKRDQLLNELDQQRQVDITKINKSKLKTALNHLDVVLGQYSSNHPAVLEALLQLSKLTYSAGRIKDSYNLLKRAKKDIERLDPDNRLYKSYVEWLDFLNTN